jgi:hypothetical protein
MNSAAFHVVSEPAAAKARPGEFVELLVQGEARHTPTRLRGIAVNQHRHAGLVEHLGQVQHDVIGGPERLPGAGWEAGKPRRLDQPRHYGVP